MKKMEYKTGNLFQFLMEKVKVIMVLMLGSGVVFASCSRDSEDGDPFEGSWKLQKVAQGADEVDVTNVPCSQDIRLTVTNTEYSLYFSVQQSAGSGQCNSQTFSGKWTKRDGKYYITPANGAEQEFPLTFSNNNQTLRFTYSDGSASFDMIFSKEATENPSDTGGVSVSKPGSGVYAGIWVIGSSRYDLAVLLRDDGTYTESLGRSDWKTHIGGTYTREGNKAILTSNSGKKQTLEYQDNYSYVLASGAYFMFKVEFVSQIPPSGYRFQNIAVLDTGGNFSASGVSGYYYFDGKGNFSNDKSAFTQTSGNGIGSGSYSGQRYIGTYTISNGELTLRYPNGSTSKHSFFYGRPTSNGGDATIVVDGNTYFQKE